MTSGPEPIGVEEYEASGEAAAAGASVGSGTWGTADSAMWGISATDAAVNVPSGARTDNQKELTQRAGGPSGNLNLRAAERGEAEAGAYNPLTTTIGALMQGLNGAGILARKHYQALLQQAGLLPANYVPKGDLDKDTVKAFGEFFVEFARQGVENPGVGWSTYLTGRAREGKESAGELEALKNPPKVRLLSYSEAAPAYRDTFRQAVGRDPSDIEINSFIDSYNAKAKENPQLTRVEMRDGVEYTSVEGGVNADDFAEQTAQDNPDYANYQAVATYFPMMERIMGAPQGDLNLIQNI